MNRQKIGVKVIQFRNYDHGSVLYEIYDFFNKAGVKCNPPPKLTWDDMEKKIGEILNDFNIENEQDKLLKKWNELTKKGS